MAEPVKLSVKPLSSGDRKRRRLEGLSVSLDDNDPKFLPASDAHSVLMKAGIPTDRQDVRETREENNKNLPSDRSTVVLRSDRDTTGESARVEPRYYGPPVVHPPRADRPTKVPRVDDNTLVPLRDQDASASDYVSIPLSELQWLVWQELQRVSQTTQRTCFQDLARSINQKKRGLQRAIEALKREGAVKLIYIKSKEFQGFSVEIDPTIRFHPGTKREVYGIVKRGQTVVPRHYGQTVVPQYSEHRMYVCKKNTYILAEDLKNLLENSPVEWRIREQTLIQIADTFPMMTALEFRLSLRRLVDQAKNGKQVIQNPNAWLKASFERNGGPLVTEREIEVRVRQQEVQASTTPPPRPIENEDRDIVSMRRYMNASLEDRAEIDRLAEERVERLLGTISPDKHARLREEARIECTQEYFGRKAKEGRAEDSVSKFQGDHD